MKKDKKHNVTKYGEFVCTEFEWLPVDKQKEQAKKLRRGDKQERTLTFSGI